MSIKLDKKNQSTLSSLGFDRLKGENKENYVERVSGVARDLTVPEIKKILVNIGYE